MVSERHAVNTNPDLAGQRCLVTGATGFVGGALVASLKASGAFVRGMARRSSPSAADELVTADLVDLPSDTSVFNDIDIVFHLAAKTHDVAEAVGVEAQYHRINVQGTERIIAAVRRRALRRFVFASSVKVIDEGNTVPATETTPLGPSTPYGRSKLAAEELVIAASRDERFEAVCLRFPLVYGPGQRGNLQRMIAAIDRGRFPPPPVNSNKRSMVHVGNAVQALLLAASHPAAAGRTYLVADARPYSTREIYDAARAALGRPPTTWAIPEWLLRTAAVGGDVARRIAGRRVGYDSEAFQKLLGTAVYDSSLIARELGYQPVHDLIESLGELVVGHRSRA